MTHTSGYSETDDVRKLLAKAFNKQASLFSVSVTSGDLTDGQTKRLVRSMRSFLQAISILEQTED